jgi:hypothetical protein
MAGVDQSEPEPRGCQASVPAQPLNLVLTAAALPDLITISILKENSVTTVIKQMNGLSDKAFLPPIGYGYCIFRYK